MGLTDNEVAAENQRRRMEGISKSSVGGVIEDAISLARPALVVVSAVAATGAAAGSALAVAGSVVAGLGIVDWFRKLGSAKVNENLESLGQATEDALNRVERVLLEHGTSITEIASRMNSQEFADGMASASLQALRTTQADRLKRLALILANGVREDDLEPEGLDDMMRAAVELKAADLILLGEIVDMQKALLTEGSLSRPVNERMNELQRLWADYWKKNWQRYAGRNGIKVLASLTRLRAAGLIGDGPDRSSTYSPASTCFWLLDDGKKFYERLQEIAA